MARQEVPGCRVGIRGGITPLLPYRSVSFGQVSLPYDALGFRFSCPLDFVLVKTLFRVLGFWRWVGDKWTRDACYDRGI